MKGWQEKMFIYFFLHLLNPVFWMHFFCIRKSHKWVLWGKIYCRGRFICTLNEQFQDKFFVECNEKKLTYPSGCNLIRYFFLLKLSFLILAHENVFILVKFWKTTTPMCATARFNGTPSWSWKYNVNGVYHCYMNIKLII